MRRIGIFSSRHLCVALMCVALPLALLGQGTTTASISGQVTDPSGAAIPGATVTITNTGTNATRVATTGANGSYAVPNLIAATYKVSVSKTGFQAAVIPELVATIGAQILQNVQLKVGSQSAEVQVTGAAPLLQTQSATMSQQVEASSISQLPLTDRNLTSIAALTMGATLPATPGTAGQYGRRQSVIVINGGRASSTNYVLDGINIRDLRFNEMSLRPIVDTVNEVQVLANSYSTEYGQGSAVMVAETKSGTNQLHGDAWEFVQNTSLNARNFFAASRLPFHNNDFGATLGGPVIKNKIFLFGGYEGVRASNSSPGGEIVPTASELGLGSGATGANLSGFQTTTGGNIGGNILDPDPNSPTYGKAFPGGIIPLSRISTMANLLSPAYPTPNSACVGPTFANDNYCGSSSFVDKNDNITVRGDATFSTANSMYVRYIWNRGNQFSYPLAQTTYTEPTINPDLAHNIVLGETWALSPTLVNTINVGYNRVVLLPYTPDPKGTNWVQSAGITNITGSIVPKLMGMPSGSISGIGAAQIKSPTSPELGSAFANAGGIGGIFQGGLNNIYSLGEKLTKIVGNQTIEMGVQIQDRRFQQNTNQSNTGSFTYNGSFSGNALADYLLGFCSSCTGAIGDTTGWYHDHVIAPFFNDVWQVTPSLTATFGVRYGYQGVFIRDDGRQANFDPQSQKVAFHDVPASIITPFQPYMNTTPNFYPAGIYSPDYNVLEPRVGLSYRMGANTVIHAGSMVSHENTNLNELQFTTNLAPLYVNYQLKPTMPSNCGTNGTSMCNVGANGSNPDVQAALAQAQIYPNGNGQPSQFFPNPATITTFPGGFPAPFAVSAGNRAPYTIQWNLNVQRMTVGNIMVQIGYEGSVTHKLWKRWDQNQALGSATGRPYLQYNTGMLTSSNMANANFNALAVSAQRRLSSGFFFLSNFQWSKAIDNNSGEVDPNDTADRANFNLDRGLSNFNQEFRFTTSLGYTTHSTHLALRNWQASSVISLTSGFPYTLSTNGICACGFAPNRAMPVAGVSPILSAPSINQWYNPKAFTHPSGPYIPGTVGRNNMIAPGVENVDFGLTRQFALGEARDLQLRAEASNLFNHANFNGPNANVDSSTAGRISSARDPREVKLGVRIVF
jgi:hypothetical protein